VKNKVVVLGTKRSCHHAFIESALTGMEYTYHNNMRLVKDGKYEAHVVVDTVKENPEMCLSSFEMYYRLPDLLLSNEFQDTVPLTSRSSIIIIIRDPLNTLASLMSCITSKKIILSQLDSWIMLAKYILS